MEQRDNMHNGKLYDPNDVSVMEEQMVCLDRVRYSRLLSSSM